MLKLFQVGAQKFTILCEQIGYLYPNQNLVQFFFPGFNGNKLINNNLNI